MSNNTIPVPNYPPPVGEPIGGSVPQKPKRHVPWKHIVGYPVTFIVASLISAGGSGSPQATPTVQPATTATVTVPVSGEGVTVTESVEVPGPVKTVVVTAAPPAPKTAIPGDGTFEVGVDVKAGTYVSPTPDSGNCYWERNNGKSGLDGIIQNNNSSGQSVVTIRSTDKFFTSNGCNPWIRRR